MVPLSHLCLVDSSVLKNFIHRLKADSCIHFSVIRDCSKIYVNRADNDKTPHSVASGLNLRC